MKEIILLLLLTISTLGLLFLKDSRSISPITLGVINNSSRTEFSTHPPHFFDQELLRKGIAFAEKESESFPYHVSGGIIPHHLLSSYLIADFFKRLSFQKPKTIILLGPNHYEKGNFKVLTSRYSWQTSFGVVESDEEVTGELIRRNLTQIDEKVVEQEHSVAAIMPFIAYYSPQTKIVPLILSDTMSLEEVKLLADGLSGLSNKETVIIAAVDFSHYLQSEEAQKKDKFTLETMKKGDYRTLLSLGNDYLDSPTSVAAIFMAMDVFGKTSFEILHHTNSGILLNNSFIPTTSYFSMTFF